MKPLYLLVTLTLIQFIFVIIKLRKINNKIIDYLISLVQFIVFLMIFYFQIYANLVFEEYELYIAMFCLFLIMFMPKTVGFYNRNSEENKL